MGVVFTPDSNYAKEMRKWNAVHTEFGPPGRPYTFQEFPKRLYRADRVDGQIKIVERFSVGNDLEQRNMESRGFHADQADAIAEIERQHTEHATLAAEREWQIQHGRVSPKAAAEARLAEVAHGARHLPDVPETPIPVHQKKRGRPAKVTTDA